LRWYGRARLYIGLSISDAISTSLLEAMVMGTFPIQSCTACADEWIEDGKTGFIVHPEDTDIIELLIRRALLEDELVDQAAEQNLLVVKERLDQKLIRSQIATFYEQVMNSPLTREV
jgi:glycosyltransferase involved in cell wall biosynthesis